MKFYELTSFCTFSEEPEIFVVRDKRKEIPIEWNSTLQKYVSSDYEYIYDEDEEIVGVNAEIVLSEDDLDYRAEVVRMEIGKWAKIKVKL